jgi:hypothetical protein
MVNLYPHGLMNIPHHGTGLAQHQDTHLLMENVANWKKHEKNGL